MKKALALLLILTVCLSFAACGGNASEKVIGTWVYHFEVSEIQTHYGNPGDEMRKVVELYAGGTGKLYVRNDTSGQYDINETISWELTGDNVVNIEYSVLGKDTRKEGFEYQSKSDTLVKVDGAETFSRENG